MIQLDSLRLQGLRSSSCDEFMKITALKHRHAKTSSDSTISESTQGAYLPAAVCCMTVQLGLEANKKQLLVWICSSNRTGGLARTPRTRCVLIPPQIAL